MGKLQKPGAAVRHLDGKGLALSHAVPPAWVEGLEVVEYVGGGEEHVVGRVGRREEHAVGHVGVGLGS